MIRYYEDGHEELYRLSVDTGERNDLVNSESAKVSELSQKLDEWLEETGAKIPKPDSRFDAKKKVQQIERAKTKAMNRLEKQHANFLRPGFKPNKTWWDSQIIRD